MINLFIQVGTDLNACNERGMTPPITRLCEGPALRFAAMLMDAGGDATLVDKYGSTTLLHSINKGKDELIRMLLSRCPETLRQ